MDKTCRFFCTAGRGTEGFLEKELKETFGKDLSEVTVTDGKVFYELTGEVDNFKKILTLKTAERAFVQVFRVQTQDLDQRHLIYSLKSRLGNKDVWQDSMTVFQYLQKTSSEVKTTDTCTSVKGANSVEQETSKQSDTHSSKDSEDEPKCKKMRLDGNEISQEISFRVNFKCPARFRKRLNIKSVPKDIGVHIKQLTGWKIDLRNPQVEICVQLNKEYLTVGFPVTREPLSKRSFIKLIGLRSTVAYIMSDLLQIQKGEMVLDPMCGKATLLLEALHHHKEARYIGIDKSESQLNMARENLKFAKTDNIELMHGDCIGLPFPDDSIDKVVTDAPFGNNHTTDIPLEQFYKAILCEISRVLKPMGKLVLLTSTSIENLLRRTAAKSCEHNDSGCYDKRTTLNDNDVGHDTNDVRMKGEADQLSKAVHENADENSNSGCSDQRSKFVDDDIGPYTNNVLIKGETDQLSKAVHENTGENSKSGCSDQRSTLVDNDICPNTNDVLINGETDQPSKAVHENTYTCIKQTDELCDNSVKACKSFGKEDNSHSNSLSHDRIILDTGKPKEFNSSTKDSELSSVGVLMNEIPKNLKALEQTRGISETVETSESVKVDIVNKEQVLVNEIPQNLKALDEAHGLSKRVEISESIKADIVNKERVLGNEILQNLKALDGTSKAFKFCGISEAVETSESVKADIVVKDTGSAEDKMKQQQGKETIDLCDTYSSSEIIVDETVKLRKDYKMQSLVLLESHYIKLGETDSYVCVFEKQHMI